ncbi:MAG TPA: AtpZ/AtpI family protein [Acidimicrobiales bacterium]
MADLSARRELNRGAGDALSTAFELSVTPVLMGLIGWGLDAWIGTSPLFLLVLFVFTVCYEVWKHLALYDARMRDQQARVPGLGGSTEPEEPRQ